jgi:DNA excision repair protein ERCC-4
LVVLARGLGLLKIVTNLLHSYDAAGNSLVIVVGAEDQENHSIGEALAEATVMSQSSHARGLKVINTDKASVSTREKLYSEGGIISVTTRILIVDLLSKLLDPETVTGMVFLHAEKVSTTSMEAFVARVFRQHNKIGFVKAFSDAPEPLQSGYSPLGTTLRNLFLRKPALYPRFHARVAQSLEGKKKADVVELEIPMTDAMFRIQQAVLECVELCISELRKANSGVDLDDWSVESALHQNFDSKIRRQLDPVWHRVSFRTRQIARDLTTLREILNYLLSYDCISLLKHLDTVRATLSPPPGSTKQNYSPWLLTETAETIFTVAKNRVYSGDRSEAAADEISTSLRPVLEEQPKWALLAEILSEIETEAYFNPSGSNPVQTVLVMCNDQRTCRQIKEYLQTMHIKPEADEDTNGEAPHKVEQDQNKGSAEWMMRRKLRDYLHWRKNFNKVQSALFDENQKSLADIKNASAAGRLNAKGAPSNKRRRTRGGGAAGTNGSRPGTDREAQVALLLDSLRPDEASKQATADDPLIDDLTTATEAQFTLYEPSDQIVVHPYSGDGDDFLLEEVRPTHIIMYSPAADFIRRVEIYKSSHSSRTSLRTYFFYYEKSVEEQTYLTRIRREKEAFTRLITERASLALTIQDTHSTSGAIDGDAFLRTINTRIAGGGKLAATAAPPCIVVDMREFRSSLPSLLHGASNIVLPCQLTVADYVLSPSICVERKSVTDLIQSFKNGRLLNQAEAMLQHYQHPFLLIEFEHNKSFTLDPFADLTSLQTLKTPDADSRDLQSKLVLLTISFPRLKIIWSSSPFQTAEIFAELKKGQPEPDPLRAVQIGLSEEGLEGLDEEERTFNMAPQDLLKTVPGINNKNATRLTLETKNVMEVANMTERQLEPLVGKTVGRQVVRFFGRQVWGDEAADEGDGDGDGN